MSKIVVIVIDIYHIYKYNYQCSNILILIPGKLMAGKTNHSKRITIAFLAASFLDEYEGKIWKSVLKSAEKYDVNLICAAMGAVNAGESFDSQKNVIIDLARSDKIDGYISISQSFTSFLPRDEADRLISRYCHKPFVSIGMKVKDKPCVLVDNESGIEQVMNHLINDHNYRKIAFIQGPIGNIDALKRFNKYRDVLRDYNIPYNEKLVLSSTLLFSFNIDPIVKFLIDNLEDIDAVIGVNDYLAIEIIKKLKHLGISVPEQIAVVGFDDFDESKAIIPDLTTVHQPIFELGTEAFRLLMKIFRNDQVENEVILPTYLVKRRSCGCFSYKEKYSINSGNFDLFDQTKKNELNEFTEIITNEISKNPVLISEPEKMSNWSKQLVEVFSGIDKGYFDSNKFAIQLENIIIDGMDSNVNIFSWYPIIFKLIKLLKKFYKDSRDDNLFDELLEDALLVIGDLESRYQGLKRFTLKNLTTQFYMIAELLISVFSIQELVSVITEKLPLIGINSCYIALFTNIKDKHRSRLLAAFDTHTGFVQKNTSKKYLSVKLMPDDVDIFTKRKSCAMISLFNKDTLLGYIIIEVGPEYGELYENLSIQISNTIKSTQLLEKIQNHSLELEGRIKERTKNLNNANRKLKKLDKLKNDFIANITHDFRSPLTVIQNISDLALITKSSEKENKENYELIYTASLKLKKSIDQLLELAKMDEKGVKLKITKIDLVLFFNELINYYRSSLSNCGILIIYNPSIERINDFYADYEKLEEIVNNIISNAIKFVEQDKGIIRIDLTNKVETILITISDNGIGIQKDKLGTIFDRFEQVEERRNSLYQGTGIGLAFCKQLVELMKGKIWAESDGRGKGSRFFIELKKSKKYFNKDDMFEENNKNIIKLSNIENIVKMNIKQKAKISSITTHFNSLNAENEFDYKKGVILLIDDEDSITNIVMRYLSNHNYKNFILANNGKLALESIYQYSPDLIICDYNIPDMRGDMIHDEIINNPEYSHIPFIFLSAIADRELILKRREKGAYAFLKKPIDQEDLIITVDFHIKKYFEHLKHINQSIKDELTGVYNRKFILKILSDKFAVNKYRDISIIFFDIDNFKIYNDNYGHHFGDQILENIGNILNTTLRDRDASGRYGGDEFIILLSDTSQEKAVKVAELLQDRIKKIIFKHDNEEIKFTCSFGVASLKENESYIVKELNIAKLENIFRSDDSIYIKCEENRIIRNKIAKLLIKMADTALYKAKYTICKNCSFSRINQSEFADKICPKCGSKNIEFGRDKVITFDYQFKEDI